jgi:hypothetical protein
MPKFDLNAYADKTKADPYVLEWGEKTYTVGSPPWANIVNFRIDSADSYGEEDMDRFLSIFFGADDYRQMRDAGLDSDTKSILFLDVMAYTGERMPESMVPKAMRPGIQNGKAKAKA